MATQDDTAFVYDDASGRVTKETTKLTKNKDVVKNYIYDKTNDPKKIRKAIKRYSKMDKNRRKRILKRFDDCK